MPLPQKAEVMDLGARAGGDSWDSKNTLQIIL